MRFNDKIELITTTNQLDDYGKKIPNGTTEIECNVKYSRKMNKLIKAKTKEETLEVMQLSLEILTEHPIISGQKFVYEGKNYEFQDVIPSKRQNPKFPTIWVGYA